MVPVTHTHTHSQHVHIHAPAEGAITRLLALGRKDGAPATLVRQAYGYVRLIAKTRGPKVVLRWFPHEVADLEPVLDMLEAQDHTDHQVGRGGREGGREGGGGE